MKHQLALCSWRSRPRRRPPRPASAGGAEHSFLIEDYDAYEHFAAGDGPCVSWAGTFHEVRSGGYRLVAHRAASRPGSSTSTASSTAGSS